MPKRIVFGKEQFVDLEVWKQLDPQNNRLTKKKVEKARQKYRRDVDAETRQIHFDNRDNANDMAIPHALLRMQLKKAGEFAEQQYSIYRDVWLRLGGVESAAFIRTISWMVIQPPFDARGGSVANEEKRRFRRSGGLNRGVSPEQIRKGFDDLKTEWRDTLEIKALEWEAEAQGKALALARASDQDRAGTARTPKARLGRPPRLASDFIDFAGELWITNQHRNPGSRSNAKAQLKATDGEIGAMAARLDSKGYVPPAKYLERKIADDVKNYNSRNSNSRTGVIKTWSQLVSVSDKDHLRGMRRLLSRCAEKVRSQLPDRVRK